MKSLTLFWKELANELAGWCSTSTALDYNKLESRVEHEGMEFLTITLPTFAKGLERALERGKMVPQDTPGFAWRSGLPLFLRGFLERVFDPGSGRLLDEPCIDSIFAIRQLSMVFAKILVPCSDARREEAMRKFIQCELEVRSADKNMSEEDVSAFRRLSTLVFGQCLSDVDKIIYDREVNLVDEDHWVFAGKVLPKHGPGSTAERLLGNRKFEQREWTDRLESVFPFSEYAIPNWRYMYLQDRVDFREPGRERPVRVVPVPKTLKTPRIIAIEPTCMQYMQQAVLAVLIRRIEQDNILSRLLGFTYQEPNRLMACEGSLSGDLATLDLSEASDRVSNQHVRLLLRNFRSLFEAVDATRSRKADVPGHGVIRLAKFASMGSALCFPFEAMTFLVIILVGIERELNRQMTHKDIMSLLGRVRVYGDDIIIPVEYVRCVISALEDFGLQVNRDKSFWTGKFRESCGGDFYDGVWVTPVRIRREFPSGRKQSRELISVVSLRNQLYSAGLWSTAAWLDDQIRPMLGGIFPIVESDSAALGRHSLLPPKGNGTVSDHHVLATRAWMPVPKLPSSPLGNEGALLKCLLSLEQSNGSEPAADSEHLVFAGRSDAVYIKLGWTPLQFGGAATY